MSADGVCSTRRNSAMIRLRQQRYCVAVRLTHEVAAADQLQRVQCGAHGVQKGDVRPAVHGLKRQRLQGRQARQYVCETGRVQLAVLCVQHYDLRQLPRKGGQQAVQLSIVEACAHAQLRHRG